MRKLILTLIVLMLACPQLMGQEAVEIKPDMLRIYEQIYKSRNGQAIALADNEQCFGCSMKIPPQTYNEVVRGDTLQMCPHCRRILYVDRSQVPDGQQAACDQSGCSM